MESLPLDTGAEAEGIGDQVMFAPGTFFSALISNGDNQTPVLIPAEALELMLQGQAEKREEAESPVVQETAENVATTYIEIQKISSAQENKEEPNPTRKIKKRTTPIKKKDLVKKTPSKKVGKPVEPLVPGSILAAQSLLIGTAASEPKVVPPEDLTLIPDPPMASSILDDVGPVADASSPSIQKSKPETSKSANITVLAEGGIANLAALQAGIIPLPLSLLQQVAASQGVSLKTGEHSLHLKLSPAEVAAAQSASRILQEKLPTEPILPEHSPDPVSPLEKLPLPSSKPRAVKSILTKKPNVVRPILPKGGLAALEKLNEAKECSAIPEITVPTDLPVGDLDLLPTEPPISSDDMIELIQKDTVNEEVDVIEKPIEREEIEVQANENVDEFEEDKEVKDAPAISGEVFSKMSVTISSEMLAAMPKNPLSLLDSLASEQECELRVVPDKNLYTIICKKFSNLLAIHTSLQSVLGVPCDNLKDVSTAPSEFDTQITKKRGRPKKRVGRPRKSQKKIEDIPESIQQRPEPVQYSRSGRRLKAKKFEKFDLISKLDDVIGKDDSEKFDVPENVPEWPEFTTDKLITTDKPLATDKPVTTDEIIVTENTIVTEKTIVSSAETNGQDEEPKGVITEIQPNEAKEKEENFDDDKMYDVEPVSGDFAYNAIPLGSKVVKKRDYESAFNFKFFCKICSFKTKRQSHFDNHMKLHSKVHSLFKCSRCPFTTIRLNHLRRHEQTHVAKKVLQCTKCPYKSLKPELMAIHCHRRHQIKMNSEETEIYKCRLCDYRTDRRHLIIRHRKAHPAEPTKSFLCSKCGYTTTRKENYQRHMNHVHESSRGYLCDLCGKSFKRRDGLRAHAVVHQDKSKRMLPFKCYVCQKGLRSKAHLVEHLTTHSSQRAYLCEICGASFKTRSVQRKHVQSIHQNPHSFMCLECPRTFNTKYSLLRHTKTHKASQQKLLLADTEANEIILPNLPADEMQQIQIEYPTGEIVTQPIVTVPQPIVTLPSHLIQPVDEKDIAEAEGIASMEVSNAEPYDHSIGPQIDAQVFLPSEATPGTLFYLN